MRKKKRSLISVLFLLFLGIGIGYAVLTTKLDFDGRAHMGGNTWNIYWTNVGTPEGSGARIVDNAIPQIDPNNSTSITYHLALEKPGDWAELTVDAYNEGSVDAMVEDVVFQTAGGGAIPPYIEIEAKYSDDVLITEKQLFPANTTQTYKFRITYSQNIDKEQIPLTTQSVTLSVGVNYTQANRTAVPRTSIFYTAHDLKLDEVMFIKEHDYPKIVEHFETPQEAMSSWNTDFCMKHILAGNIVQQNVIAFRLNGDIYFLKGGDETITYGENGEFFKNDSKYYLENVQTLNDLGCNCSSGESMCKCNLPDFVIQIYANGHTDIFNSDYVCVIDNHASGACISNSE